MNWYDHILTSDSTVEQTTEPAGKSSAGNDPLLFARFLDGDDAALVELFDRHNHRLFLYCMQLLHDPQLAQDVTQEMWERVIRLRARKRATAENPLGLLLTIARNLCLDEIRKRRSHAALDDLPEARHPRVDIPEMSHLEELVILALTHLPLAQREVLILNFYSGYRFDEISNMLGEPVGAVRTRAWRARSHLGRIISAMIGMNEDNEGAGERDQPGGSDDTE